MCPQFVVGVQVAPAALTTETFGRALLGGNLRGHKRTTEAGSAGNAPVRRT